MSSAAAPGIPAESLRDLREGSAHLPAHLGDDLARVPRNTTVDRRPPPVVAVPRADSA
jgi:hypothetical protein